MAIVFLFTDVVTWPLLVPSILFLLITTLAVQKYVAYRRLAQFQGPFWASWTELWVAKMTWESRMHTAMRDLNDTYGSIARAGPNLLITNDIEFLKRISAPRSKYARTEWNMSMKLDPRIDNTISTLDEKRHSELRSMLSHGYSGRDIPSRESRVDERVLDLVHLIETKYISSKGKLRILDLARISQYFTLDVITDMAFGDPFGFLAADADIHNYITSIGALMPVFELQANVTWIAAILNNEWVKKLMAPTANDGSAFGEMIGAAQQAVRARYKPGAEEKDDMLNSFMKRGITQLEAESESLLQVLAGADSTATAVRMIMYQIMTNPPVYAKLQAEVDNASIAGLVISDAEANALPYLQAVIKEGLRAWPPGVGISTKLVPPEGESFEDGRFIPGGTRVGWSAWGTQHNKDTYGEDAQYFRPERWFDSGERMAKMERVIENLFGSGRYGCLGKTLAMLELNKVFVTLLRRYEITLLDPATPFKSKCNGFFVQSGILVRVVKRT